MFIIGILHSILSYEQMASSYYFYAYFSQFTTGQNRDSTTCRNSETIPDLYEPNIIIYSMKTKKNNETELTCANSDCV